jgi:acetyltransferase-like isoleucine patch superfamily enzyme
MRKTNIIHKTAKIHPNVKLGDYNKIGRNVIIETSENNASVFIGDNNIINDNTRIIVSGELNIGDWNVFHNNMLLMVEKHITIGHNCWFGQNTILDGTGGLRIGNGVRVGMYSQIWTHVGSGERIEGCTLYSKSETILNDDVWLVGSCVVGSGIELGKRSIMLINSVVTKDTLPNKTYSGMPAKIMKNLEFYKPIKLEEKFQMLKAWLLDFASLYNCEIIESEKNLLLKDKEINEEVLFTINSSSKKAGSVFYLKNKTFNKTNSSLERRVYKFLYNNKARFLPIKN